MAKPQYRSMDSIQPLSEIIPGLFQGMRPRSYQGYDLVISCEEYHVMNPFDGGRYKGMFIHIPMRDDDLFKIPEQEIWAAVFCLEAVINMNGGRALVHCTGGLNRSSLITGEYLKAQGYSNQDAIALLRTKRDPMCLCNRAFERWVSGEVLPTAETSAFNLPASPHPSRD